LVITLNGERFELDQPISVSDLLAKLAIDARRVAVEHNLTIVKRQTFSSILVREGYGGDRKFRWRRLIADDTPQNRGTERAAGCTGLDAAPRSGGPGVQTANKRPQIRVPGRLFAAEA
jgi:thiamine biosynthesis protein ThiS